MYVVSIVFITLRLYFSGVVNFINATLWLGLVFSKIIFNFKHYGFINRFDMCEKCKFLRIERPYYICKLGEDLNNNKKCNKYKYDIKRILN